MGITEFKETPMSELITILQQMKPANRDPVVRFYAMTDGKQGEMFCLGSIGVVAQINHLGPDELVVTLKKAINPN